MSQRYSHKQGHILLVTNEEQEQQARRKTPWAEEVFLHHSLRINFGHIHTRREEERPIYAFVTYAKPNIDMTSVRPQRSSISRAIGSSSPKSSPLAFQSPLRRIEHEINMIPDEDFSYKPILGDETNKSWACHYMLNDGAVARNTNLLAKSRWSELIVINMCTMRWMFK